MRLAFLTACLAFVGLAAQADPSYHRVTGVAADDTLNVRIEPSADSADIGDLPPDARGIEVTGLDASGGWGRIVWEEGNGWIAMRFLAADPQPSIPGTELPQGLLCGGTEPFWSLRLSGGGAAFSDAGGAAMILSQTGAISPQAQGAFPVIVSHGSSEAAAMSVVEPMECSDGMSDRTYPWRALFLLRTASDQRLLAGCCQLPLEAGSH